MKNLIQHARARSCTVCRMNLRRVCALLLSMLVIGIGLLLCDPAPVSASPETFALEYPLLEAGPAPLAATAVYTPTFTPQSFGGWYNYTEAIAVGDVNGDGALDIIQDNWGQQSVVYLNDGHGGFGAGLPFGDANAAWSIAVGDLNGDGALDIVQGKGGVPSVVCWNDGHGGFSAGTPFGDAYWTWSIAVGDVNGDGVLDIIQGNSQRQSVVYLNDGHGGFGVGMPLGDPNIDTLSRGIAVGDMNGDGALDLIMNNPNRQSMVLYFNDGQGGFGAGVPFGGASWNASIAVGDMNGDGALDIVQSNAVYLNDGQGRFDAQVPFGDVNGTWSAAVGDVNGDGALDIVQSNAVYLNDGRGGFGTQVPFGGAYQALGIAVGDVDGDGALDIIQGNWGQQNFIYLNDGQGGFRADVPFGVLWGASAIAVGDVNGDGALDIVQGVDGADQMSAVCLNDGQGRFGACQTYGDTYIATSVALGDVNGDGALDIIQGSQYQSSTVYLNDGYGGFGIGVPFGDSNSGPIVAVGDVDGNGALDIILGDCGQPSVVYVNDGHGGFGATMPLSSVYNNTSSIAVGDLNGDGALDIVQGNGCDSYVLNWQPSTVYLNDGSGKFSVGMPFGAENWTVSIAVGDMNGDGALDIVQGNADRQSMVYLNDGRGGFGEAVPFGGMSGTWPIAVGDVNGDGALDITQGNAVYLNNRDGGFGAAMPFGSENLAISIALGDVNGDGALDIVQGKEWDQSVVHLSSRFDGLSLPNNPPAVALTRPGRTGNAGFFSASDILSTTIIPITYTLFDPEGDPARVVRASYSPDGGGKWYSAVAVSDTLTTTLTSRRYHSTAYLTPTVTLPDNGVVTSTLVLTATSPLTATDVKVWVVISHTQAAELRLVLQAPTGVTVTLMNTDTLQGVISRPVLFDDAALTSILTATAPYSGAYRPTESLTHFNGLGASGAWQLRVENTAPGITGTLCAWGLRVQDSAGVHVYRWDTFASGFFGHSDNVVFRIEAYPSLTSGLNGVPVFQHPYASATTFPFRVRGTQVRVVSDTITGTVPIPNAIVYRLPAGQSAGGAPVANQAGVPFRTDSQGYLQGRGEIAIGDQLLALAPVYDDLHYAGVLELDGQDDYAIQNPLHSAPITATTIAFWMRSDDTAGSGTPLSYATTDEADALLITNYNDLTIYRGPSYVQTGVSATDGAWHHIAVTWRSSDGQVKLYKDGAAAFTGTLTATSLITGSSLVLGQDQDSLGGGFDPAQAFSGSLDEVSIWRVARSAAEIQADMFRSLGGAEPGLVAYWPFDDDSETAALDHAGHGNDATLHGATWDGESLGGYTVYHTNGQPTLTGIEAFTVTEPGVQVLTVSAEHPLTLFDLDVSLEWDAHNDPVYLDQLAYDLQKASRFLYDFSDGQAALGQVTVHQNGDDWLPAHVAIQASNRLQPYAVQGGIVFTPTVDAQHDDIVYDMGQVRMGATWNRYGDPGQGQGLDWQLALAHELSHFLFYQDDVYLGLDDDGLLIPVDTCTGSAMGDVYLPDNTEFVYDEGHWAADCADTLANRTLDRTEWETMRLWYPWLVTPTITNTGPSLMPFDLTTVSVLDPITPTNALEDPTFYVDYAGGVDSSSQARAFVLRDEYGDAEGYDYVIELGSPATGEQNRVLARGAQPGDRLCLFDPAQRQYGCEVVELGDNRLALERDETWTPALRLSPVTSQTIQIEVSGLPPTFTLLARLYPEYEVGSAVITLTHGAGVYSGTFRLDYPPLAGHVQVWVNEGATETDPRREIVAAYAIGGNPGGYRGGGPLSRSRGPLSRSRGPLSRSRGPLSRSRGPLSRSRGAPLGSSDGELIFFVENPLTFHEGELYAIQSAGSLPSLPSGKVAIGQGYSLIASPNVTQPITSSISFRYLSIDVLAEGVDEDKLVIHFWDTERKRWRTLDTVLDTYYNMASAPGQGSGVYILLAGVTIPHVEAVTPPAATNDVTTTLVISGGYFLEPVEVALVSPTATYTLPLLSVSPYSITAVVTRGLPAREYEVVVTKRREGTSPIPGTFALYAPPLPGACFYDYFESGAGRWQPGGDWDIGILPSSERAVTDSPAGNYDNAIPPAITHTTYITSIPFSLAACPDPVLTFRHDYVIARLGPSVDVGRVEISADGGANWTELASYSGGGIYPPPRGPEDVPSPEWTDVEWEDVRISLSAYTGTVRLRFALEVDQTVSDKGWVIDDVVVRPASLVPHPVADLQLSVTRSGQGMVIAGAPVTYTLVVTNAGPTIVDAVMTDTFPITHTTFASCSGGCSGVGPVAWSLADFTGTQTFTLVLGTSASFSGTLANSAVITPTTPYAVDPVPGNNADSVSTLIRYFMADLQVRVAREGSGAIIAGGQVTYTLTLTNAGPDIVDAVVTDTFPISYTALASCSGGCSGTGPVAWSLADFTRTQTFTLVLETLASYSGTLANSAVVTPTTPYAMDPVPGNNADSVDTLIRYLMVDLQVRIAHEGSGAIIAGGQVTYTLIVTNTGPDTVDAVVTDTFPISYTTLAFCSGACVGTGPVAWSLPDFTGTRAFTLVLGTSASYSGTLANSAIVTLTTPYAVDPVLENNQSSDTVWVSMPREFRVYLPLILKQVNDY